MAAQRPSGQAWFRMPTMRPPAPVSAPSPVSPPAVAMPTRPQTQPQVTAAPPPAASIQLPSPPPKSPIAPPAASPAPPQQPPSPPPEIKARAPSPLQLPPSQLKPEEEDQKIVLVQERIEKQPLKNNYASKGKRDTPTKHKKQLSDSDELGMRIITIAGENRGALMEINSSNKKQSRNGHTLTENSKNGKAKANESGEDEQCDERSQPITTFLNSNVQGVNNSIVYNSSCNHNDPGIHLSLLRKLNHHG